MSPRRAASWFLVAYADAFSFSVMESIECRHVLGFDRDFEAAGFELWRPPA